MEITDIKLEQLNINERVSESIYKHLSECFYNTDDIEEDNNVTKQLLTTIRDYGITKKEIKMFFKGITKHMEDHRKEFRENGLILTSCIFKYEGFKIDNFFNYQIYKEIIVEIFGFSLGKEKALKNENKANTIDNLPTKNGIKYLKPAIEMLKNNEDKKFKEIFENLVNLIRRSSDRTLKQAKDFIKPIIMAEYDSYSKIEAIALLIEKQENLLNFVVNEIFLDNYCVKNKVDLIFSIIVYIERVLSCNYLEILKRIEDNKKRIELHKVVERYLRILEDKLKKYCALEDSMGCH